MVHLTTKRDKFGQKNIHERLITFLDDQIALRRICNEIGLTPYAIEDMIILKKNLHLLLVQIFSYYFNVNHHWLSWGIGNREIHSVSYPHELFWTHEADRVVWLLWTSGYSLKNFCKKSEIEEEELRKWISAAGRIELNQCERISNFHPAQPGKQWASSQGVAVHLDERGKVDFTEERIIDFFRNQIEKPKVELLSTRIKINVNDFFLTKSV